MREANRRVLVAANTAWNIVNFRGGLIRALQVAGYEPIVVAPVERESTERIRQLGVEHIPIAISRSGMNPAADAQLVLAYRQILRKAQPFAFLGFTIKPNIYGSLAARMSGIPAISNISGLGSTFATHDLLQLAVSQLYRFSLAKNATVFFQNADDRALFLQRELVRIEQARLLPGSGIDLDHFSAQPMPAGPPSFLLVARLLADKGVRQYVEAAGLLRKQFPEVRFQLLGPLDEDNPTAIPSAELNEWIGAGAVEYCGQTEDVRPFIKAATAVVLPSYYREGVPHILLEAAAMARPIITTDTPGCREAVDGGATGFLCAPRSVKSLVDAMTRILLAPPSLREKMGRAGRRKMEDQFGEEIVHHAYLDALRGFLV